ncbi:MAG: acyl carrier protein [Prevotellaceae bacterium]|jgi:acyl carrier protein|nr:acyl carrier protein [Prevotellaceae bacterium]
MQVEISNVNSIQELSEKLKGECRIDGIKGKRLTVTYENKQFGIKRNVNDEHGFIVDLIIPSGIYILGTVMGIIPAYVTGLTGFIPIFIFLLIALFIYKTVNKAKLRNFVALLEGVAANEKTEDFSQKKVLSQREDIRQRVFAVISKQLNLICPLNEEMTFHGLRADMLDLVEIDLKLEKEFGIVISYDINIDNAGPATRRYLEKHNVRGGVGEIVDVGNIGIVIDMVVELVNAKQNEGMKPLTDEQPAKSTEKNGATSNETVEQQCTSDADDPTSSPTRESGEEKQEEKRTNPYLPLFDNMDAPITGDEIISAVALTHTFLSLSYLNPFPFEQDPVFGPMFNVNKQLFSDEKSALKYWTLEEKYKQKYDAEKVELLMNLAYENAKVLDHYLMVRSLGNLLLALKPAFYCIDYAQQLGNDYIVINYCHLMLKDKTGFLAKEQIDDLIEALGNACGRIQYGDGLMYAIDRYRKK